MTTEKALKLILDHGGFPSEESHFNPLLSSTAVGNVSKSLCESLRDTANCENSKLKKRIRLNIVDIIQRLSKSTHISLRHAETTSDIFVKHLYTNRNKKKCIRNRKYARIKEEIRNDDLWFLYKVCEEEEEENKVPKTDLELGMALMNLDGPNCKEALSDIVNRCLHVRGDVDDASMEFLKNIWDREELIVGVKLYEDLTQRFICFIERKLLIVAVETIESYIGQEILFDSILHKHLPNRNILFSSISNSQSLFTTFFRILSDIWERSKFNASIKELISFLLQEIKHKSKFESLNHLYPYHLNSILLYLDDDPDEVMSFPDVYEKVFVLINDLEDVADFIMLMSHYPKWLEHYVRRCESKLN